MVSPEWAASLAFWALLARLGLGELLVRKEVPARADSKDRKEIAERTQLPANRVRVEPLVPAAIRVLLESLECLAFPAVPELTESPDYKV